MVARLIIITGNQYYNTNLMSLLIANCYRYILKVGLLTANDQKYPISANGVSHIL